MLCASAPPRRASGTPSPAPHAFVAQCAPARAFEGRVWAIRCQHRAIVITVPQASTSRHPARLRQTELGQGLTEPLLGPFPGPLGPLFEPPWGPPRRPGRVWGSLGVSWTLQRALPVPLEGPRKVPRGPQEGTSRHHATPRQTEFGQGIIEPLLGPSWSPFGAHFNS